MTVRFREAGVEVVLDGHALPAMSRKAAEPLDTVGLFIDAARADFRDFRVTTPHD